MQKDVIQKMVQENSGFEDIQNELKKQFGEHALKKAMIYRYMGRAKLGVPLEEENRQHENLIDEQLLIIIQQEVQTSPYFSVRSLAHKHNCCPNLVYRYLTDELHLIYRHTRWIPHTLNSSQKQERKAGSLALLQVLQKCKHYAYMNIITGDQSWFIYKYAPLGAWVLEGDEAPSYENHSFISQKMMITVIWGVYGTFIVDDLPEGQHYNSEYFIENILKPLEGKKDQIWLKRKNIKIWLHLDNCRVHNSRSANNEMKKSGFKRAPHPPYSPDLAPSDFFLFGYVKGKLRGHSYTEREDLYEAIISIINIQKDGTFLRIGQIAATGFISTMENIFKNKSIFIISIF